MYVVSTYAIHNRNYVHDPRWVLRIGSIPESVCWMSVLNGKLNFDCDHICLLVALFPLQMQPTRICVV